MHVVFLSSRLPLTKTFAMSNGVMTVTPYPHVSKVTSHHEEAFNLQDLHDLLVKHAAKGHCLFGGQLTKPLKAESRAGLTARTQRDWVVFDFDKVEAKDHVEVVKKYLPPECQQVSYIAQLSASMFRPDVELWSGHIFMLLDKPLEPEKLKQWFEYLNFSIPALSAQVTLSDSEHALHWPLDHTVAYNSKLIFIAPPKCYGFDANDVTPIELVKKKKATLSVPNFNPIDGQTIRQKINELRRNIGLDELSYNLTPFEGSGVLDQSGECAIHGIRTSGDHYIRFNLNGGDSYAYFIDLRKPELIRNFKGEPYLKTEEAAPDLWKSLRKAAPRAAAKAPLEDGVEILAFYATNQNSNVKIGSFDPATNNLVLHTSGERAARAWLTEYGVVRTGDLPHMDLVFDPQVDLQYISGDTRINTFKATQYMTRERTNPKPSTVADVPPLANRIMRSMLGDPTEEIFAHFINWLAYVYQFRKKTTTAWVLSGTEGTGKGSFVKYFLRPIFGNSAVRNVQFGLLAQEYNDFLEQALFVVFEEADALAAENQPALHMKLRHIITDDPITIRKMRTDPYEAASYVNCLFMSNTFTPVKPSAKDRRYNIAERQDKRMFLSPNELKILQTGAELEQMADVLQRWPVDEQRVIQLIETKAKADVHEATSTINQLIAEAVMKGDLQFFIDRMPSDAEAMADFHNKFSPIGMFKALIDKYTGCCGKPVLVKDEDLFVLFRTLIPDTRYFQDSKTWRKRHYKSLGLDVDKQHRIPGDPNRRERGLMITWVKPEFVETKPKIEGNVSPMAGRTKQRKAR